MNQLFFVFSTIIINTPSLNEIFLNLVNTLFLIADNSYVDNGWISRGAALEVLFPQNPYRRFSACHPAIGMTVSHVILCY